MTDPRDWDDIPVFWGVSPHVCCLTVRYREDRGIEFGKGMYEDWCAILSHSSDLMTE